MGDVNLLKLCLMIINERILKFTILTQIGTKKQNLSDIIAFIMKTARYESHKELNRNLQTDLAVLEECAEVNVLFEDRGSGQLYTIAYTEDDDFKNTNVNLINVATERMKKLYSNPLKNAALIADYKKDIKRKNEELKLDMDMREMILNLLFYF